MASTQFHIPNVMFPVKDSSLVILKLKFVDSNQHIFGIAYLSISRLSRDPDKTGY